MRVEVAALPPAGYGDIALTLYYFNVPESGDRDHLMFISQGVICLRVGVIILRF